MKDGQPKQGQSITSHLKHMGEPMRKAICKACAGPAITARQQRNATAPESLRHTGEGEDKSLQLYLSGTAALPFFTSPQVRKLFSGFSGGVLTGENDYAGTTENPVTLAFGQG